MITEPLQPMSIFLSYHQKDEALKQEFEDYLIMLQDTGFITGWAERQVQQRLDWSQQPIDPRLSQANLFLLFVSLSLLASGYCSGAEFLEAFEQNKERFESNNTSRKMALVPILIASYGNAGRSRRRRGGCSSPAVLATNPSRRTKRMQDEALSPGHIFSRLVEEQKKRKKRYPCRAETM